MRHFDWVPVGCAILALSIAPARAAVIADEPFNYSAIADLNGLTGGIGWSTAWSEPLYHLSGPTDNIAEIIASPSLGFGTLVTSGNRLVVGGRYSYDFRKLSAPLGADGTTRWVSFLLRRDTAGPDPLSLGNDFGGIVLGEDGEGTPLFIGRDEATGLYTLSNLDRSQNHPSGVSETRGATVRLVVRMNFTAALDTIDLFIDPSPSLMPTVPAATKSDTDLKTFSQLAVMTGSSATWSLDEIRIGDTYADLSVVPEPATLATLCLAWALLIRRGAASR